MKHSLLNRMHRVRFPIRRMRVLLLASGVLIFLLAFPRFVAADFGLRMIRIECDAATGAVIVEPFILWNKNRTHRGISLKEPRKYPKQTHGNSAYYFVQNPFSNASIFDHECSFDHRSVKIHFQYKEITIEDADPKATSRFSVNLDDKSVGSVWDGWGPTYWLDSSSAHIWRACRGRDPTARI
jgi:hypothetical protein